MVTTKDRGTELDDRSVIDANSRTRQSRGLDSRAGKSGKSRAAMTLGRAFQASDERSGIDANSRTRQSRGHDSRAGPEGSGSHTVHFGYPAGQFSSVLIDTTASARFS